MPLVISSWSMSKQRFAEKHGAKQEADVQFSCCIQPYFYARCSGQSVGFALASEGEGSLGIWNDRTISPG